MKIFAWLFLIAGIWLILAPFVLGYTAMARWNDIIVGLLVGVFGFISLDGGKEDFTNKPK